MAARNRKWLAAYRIATWISSLRRPRIHDEHVRSHVWPEATRRTGLRFTERLRDCFRREWLRIHRP
jgi:hypothetical protein